MESVRNEYLLILSVWMVCADAGSAQWNDTNNGVSGKRLVLPFRTNVAVIIVALTTLLTLAFLLLVYTKHRRVARNRGRRRGLIVHRGPAHLDRSPGRLDRSPSRQARPVISAGVLPRRDTGVERSVIDALPVFEFASLQGLKEGLECVVCLSRFEGSEVLRLLPKCRHTFHVVCLDRWLEYNSTCPMCRQKVEADDVFKIYQGDNVEEAEGFHHSAPQLLQAFVQRENVDDVEREPELCLVPAGSFRQPSGPSESVESIGCFGSRRKKELLISEVDEESKELQFSRRFAHRIVVADVMCQHRWSDVKHSDLLFLRSQMIATDSGRMAFADVNLTKEVEKSRRTTQTKRLGESSARIGQKRSMSEIIGFNRFQSCARNNNIVLPVTKYGLGDEKKWFYIAQKSMQSLASTGNANEKGMEQTTE